MNATGLLAARAGGAVDGEHAAHDVLAHDDEVVEAHADHAVPPRELARLTLAAGAEEPHETPLGAAPAALTRSGQAGSSEMSSA